MSCIMLIKYIDYVIWSVKYINKVIKFTYFRLFCWLTLLIKKVLGLVYQQKKRTNNLVC